MKLTGRLMMRIAAFLTCWMLLSALPLLFGTVGILEQSAVPVQLLRELTLLAAAVVLNLGFYRLDGELSGFSVLTGRRPGEGILLGGGIGVLFAGSVLLVFQAGGLMSFRSQLFRLEGLAFWLLALLLRAVWISMLCCGYLFTLLEKHFGPAGALLGNMMLYLLLCGKIWETGAAAAANGLAIGLLLALLRLLSGGFAAPASAVFLWNFAAGFVFNGLPLDGYPHLTEVVFQGPIFLSGGKNGMNGSFVTMGAALFCCGILLAAWIRIRRERAGGEKSAA